jgi:LysM repeat protein
MRYATTLIAFAAFASSTLAHMDMQEPAPFRSKFNTNVPSEKVDFDMVAPLAADGSDFPCKGFIPDFDQSPDGNPTATWASGSKQQVTIVGGAEHGGGSCQLSLSFDKGKTFRVVKSFEGGCPVQDSQILDFTVPDDTKSGKAVFAWTWFNQIGNREMYMNCAAVEITGSGTSDLEDRPEMFVANIGDSPCTVPEGTDVKFPDPGPDVEVLAADKLGPPTGELCDSSSPAPEPEAPTSEESEPTPTSEPSTEPSTDSSTEPTATESADPTPTDSGDDDDEEEEPTCTTDPNESVEPSNSVYPEEPVEEPTESAEPSNSVEPSEPVDEPTESVEPSNSVEPSEPVDEEPEPTESAEPSKFQSESEPAAEPTPTPTDDNLTPGSTSTTSKAPVPTTTSPVGTTYTVKPGDICQNIAASQGVTLSKLLELNSGINDGCTNLEPGQVLNLRRRSRIMRDLH